MRIYQKILWVIGIVVLGILSVGTILVITEVIPRFVIIGVLTTLHEEMMISLISFIVFGFFLGLAIYLPFTLKREEDGVFVSLKNPQGEVEISQKAICEFIQRIGKEIKGVEDVKASIKPGEEGMDVFLSLSTWAEGEIPRLIDEVQTTVKNYLNQTIGVESVREVKVKVNRILYKKEGDEKKA